MGVFRRLSERPLSPAAAAVAATAYAVFFGAFGWGLLAGGRTGLGIAFLVIFDGIPAVAFAIIRIRRRRGIAPRPRTPVQRLRLIVRLILAAAAVLAVFALMLSKPADRLPGGIIVGVYIAFLAFMTIPRS